jgi:hypothetical protein
MNTRYQETYGAGNGQKELCTWDIPACAELSKICFISSGKRFAAVYNVNHTGHQPQEKPVLIIYGQFCLKFRQQIIPARKLYIGLVRVAWGRYGMDSAALRAFADKSCESEAGSAPPAGGFQAAIGYLFFPEPATVGVINKFHQFPAFGKGARTVSAACTVSHN